VVGGGVGTGLPWPKGRGEHLLGVVAPHPDRVVAEAGPLNVAAADSFSLCTVTSVASMSNMIVSPRSVPATLEPGSPPRLASWAHTCRRTFARALSTRLSAAGVSSSRVRHTVGGRHRPVDVGDRLTPPRRAGPPDRPSPVIVGGRPPRLSWSALLFGTGEARLTAGPIGRMSGCAHRGRSWVPAGQIHAAPLVTRLVPHFALPSSASQGSRPGDEVKGPSRFPMRVIGPGT
jgi:hypothetical protein